MSDRPDQELVKAIANVAHSTPAAWRDFLRAFEEFTSVAKDQCVMSGIDQLPAMQGRARGIAEVNDLLKNAEKTADRMTVRRNIGNNA
jgi:hypothetical protein